MKAADDLYLWWQADLRAAGIPRWGVAAWLKHDVMRYQRLLRRVEWLESGHGALRAPRLLWAKWRLHHLGRYLGLELPPGVFGPGLAIVHPAGIVVNRRARVGYNCRIHAGVNIGEHRGACPIIGNDVYLGPGAKIVGGIRIGDAAVVGANAVVVDDVPSGRTVGGVPARVIAERDSREMIPVKGFQDTA
jgi:serine O-acetyltransferase